MEKTFVIDGVEFTAQDVTAIPGILTKDWDIVYDENERTDALLVQWREESGEWVDTLYFGAYMPEDSEQLAQIMEDEMYPESDYETLATVQNEDGKKLYDDQGRYIG